MKNRITALCFLLLVVYMPDLYSQVTGVSKLPDLIPYRKGNKWGFCDRKKKIVIPVDFDDAGLFGKAPEHINVVLPDSFAWVKKGNEEYWISKKGKLTSLINAKFPEAEEEIGVMQQRGPTTYKEVFFIKGGNVGLVNSFDKKDTLLPPLFNEIDAEIYRKSDYVIVREGKWGIVKVRSAKWIVKPEYDVIDRYFRVIKNGVEGEGFKVKRNGLTGVAINDSLIIPARYKRIEPVGNDVRQVFVGKYEDRLELVNMYGTILTKEIFDDIRKEDFYYGDVAAVARKGMWGLVSINGKQLVACKYEACNRFMEDLGVSWVKYKGKKGIIDAKGTEYFED